MIVAIDGPAGTGKSTVAKRVARQAGFCHLNSGGFYRAITFQVLEAGIDLREHALVVAEAQNLSLEFEQGQLLVNGTPRSGELRMPRVDQHVAELSSIPEVRRVVDNHLRRIADGKDVVAEGRDMATVVFPDADVKIYLDASIEARAKRRHEDLGGRVPLPEVMDAIRERDRIDTTKPVGRLIVDPSALYIDSSLLTIDQVCEIVLRTILSQNHTTGAFRQS